MTREIKFRAWDKLNKEMTLFSLFERPTATWGKQNDCQIMQFTGLKDKNGKEIYEGDIVGWVPKGSAGKVYFEGGRFRVEDFYMASFDEPSDAFGEGLGILEIIGNVYENQELLK